MELLDRFSPFIFDSSHMPHELLTLATAVTINWEGTIIHQVERIAAQYPGSLAIKDDDGKSLSYTEMMARICQISVQIQAQSVHSGSSVAMLLSPSTDAICCLLAVMRSGLVWVPLDLRNPTKRLSAIVADSQTPLIVCNSETKDLANLLRMEQTRILCLDSTLSPPQSSLDMPIDNGSQRNQTAAIFYTSGSTGTPKGVKVNHLAILNQIFVNTLLFSVGREIVLQQTSYGFDIVLDQIFQALANGGTLIVVGQKGRGDPVHISQLVFNEQVTYTHIVPSEYQLLFQYGMEYLKQCHSWRLALAAGEKVTHHLRRAFQQLNLPNVQLVNAYGPTECTITCARGLVPYRTDEDVMNQSDGLMALPNYVLRILDDDLKPSPIGFPGELCVLGIGVAQGYTNNPEEEDRRFLDADAILGGKQTSKLYRTGDQARMLEDGSVTILGRIEGDCQVKIRGIRIELDEIANVIIKASRGTIINAAASWRADRDLLAAFVVFDLSFDGSKYTYVEELKKTLPLPSYMCPAVIVPVENMPLNSSGKQDRSAIDSWPVAEIEPTISIVDLTDAEKRMMEIWSEVLVERLVVSNKIDTSTDFFQVGGNSILLIKLRSNLERTFNVNISLPELFQSSTLGNMVKLTGRSDQSVSSYDTHWNAELEILYHNLPQPQVLLPPQQTSSIIVLLSGATGFLGRNILQHLVDDERVEEVHCVSIRPDNLQQPRRVPVKHEKIVEYPGNLEHEQLGLSDSEFRYLSERVHVIIHNGAQVSFLKTYSSLHRANVLSTKVLCQLAIPRRVPFHFVSTASVATVATQIGPLSETSVSPYAPQPNSSNGYRGTKWVSECLLEHAQKVHGLPVWIHRPASIIGDGAPELDIMTAILKYSRLLGAVPWMDRNVVEGDLDMIPVEDVSNSLAEAVLNSVRLAQQTAPRFIHYCNHSKVQPEKFKDHLESIDSKHYQVVELQEWLGLALRNGLSRLLYDFMTDAFGAGKKVVLPSLIKGVELDNQTSWLQ